MNVFTLKYYYVFENIKANDKITVWFSLWQCTLSLCFTTELKLNWRILDFLFNYYESLIKPSLEFLDLTALTLILRVSQVPCHPLVLVLFFYFDL